MIILIADDEKLNRFIIKSMLGEILTSEYTILEASDGKKMVEICKEKMPDIVFTDIRMPNMNGIEAIAECKKYSDDIEFVIISGYSEFEFAQKAFADKIQDYLLKPVEEERLRQLMDKLQKKISGHKKEQNTRFQLALFNAFNYFSTREWKKNMKKTILVKI